ncbi:MAG: hypothetical protein H7239_00600 [Flavobacterium sp.]|nr:hypothetical protein [Flavobacterium sp.]
MGLFGNSDKKIIKNLYKKSEEISNDISKEIDQLFDELKSDYDENQEVVSDFSSLVNELKSKLSPDDAKKLADFSTRLSKIKSCARKGVDAMREISRDQKKATRETMREYEEYIFV